MQYFIASDHAGVQLKEYIIVKLKQKQHDIIDLGPSNNNRVDYPDYALKVCDKILKNKSSQGILICGSGIGMSMTANKIQGIRAALCHNEYSAQMAREHNDANVLCLGERVTGEGMIDAILDRWENATFQQGRHAQRVEKINQAHINTLS